MCVFVYLGSDHLLPVIPWDDGAPAFSVALLDGADPYEESVRKQVTRKHVYLANTAEGCGCGFSYGQMPPDLAEDDEEAAGRESVNSFRDYVAAAAGYGPVEVYAVWAEDEGHPPRFRMEVSPEYFGGESFCFDVDKEPEFFVVSAEEGSP